MRTEGTLASRIATIRPSALAYLMSAFRLQIRPDLCFGLFLALVFGRYQAQRAIHQRF